MKISDITNYIESIAPPSLQESYDNAGLIVGNKNTKVNGILISLDVIEEVVDEAIELGYNLIIAHHPIVFGGLKRFNGNNYVERTVIKAIKNDIAIYAAHTNLDAVIKQGVNSKISQKLGLISTSILDPAKGVLKKIVTFVPTENADKVRKAITESGAGQIGAYDSCTFNMNGEGTYRGGDDSNPYVGKKGEIHTEPEIRIETVVPAHKVDDVVRAMMAAHPYEKVAYDIYKIENTWSEAGSGMIGELETPMDEMDFLKELKKIFGCESIRYTQLSGKPIKKVALCGGSGSFLLNNAKRAEADIFITGDFKYHQFFDAENEIVIADIGHFESEQFTKELFYELLTEKFPTFAIRLTKINTNPIKYI